MAVFRGRGSPGSSSSKGKRPGSSASPAPSARTAQGPAARNAPPPRLAEKSSPKYQKKRPSALTISGPGALPPAGKNTPTPASREKVPSSKKYLPPHKRGVPPKTTPPPTSSKAPTGGKYIPPHKRGVAASDSAPANAATPRALPAPTPRPRGSPSIPRGSSSPSQRTPPPLESKAINPRVAVQRPPWTLIGRSLLAACVYGPPISPVSPPILACWNASRVVAAGGKASRRSALANTVVPYLDIIEDLSSMNLSAPPPIVLPIKAARATKLAFKKKVNQMEICAYRKQKLRALLEVDE